MTHDASSENLRKEVRNWLKENVPADWRKQVAGTSGEEAFPRVQRDWFDKLVAAGYATPHWPEGWPGGGRSLEEQKIIFEEIARADAPRLIMYFVALYHAASTLFECGTEEQKQRYLPAILKGETWCQGFSEPNAGSDLAALRTKAELRGDKYIVNGQKIWSTMAQHTDMCLLLVRTGTMEPPQAGITYLLMDMKSKGVTVRPISQITGDEEFCEIFLDDVEVPVANRVGKENDGWAVKEATLASERGLTLVELTQRMRYNLKMIAKTIRERGLQDDVAVRRDFGVLVSRTNAACALSDWYLQRRISGQEGVGDASLVKLYYPRILREFTLLGMRVGGLEAQYLQDFERGSSLETGNWPFDFMNSYNWTIAGGSDEVQKNIIAERMLGMPREPKSWKVTS